MVGRKLERDIIYCGNNNILRVIYENEEQIYSTFPLCSGDTLIEIAVYELI
jgi:hypothetical protein